jgi:hypothetical protein
MARSHRLVRVNVWGILGIGVHSRRVLSAKESAGFAIAKPALG